MAGISATATPIDIGGVSEDVLRRRISLVPWVVVVGNALFAATDPWLNPGLLRELGVLKAVVIGAQLLGLVILRRRPRRRGAIAIGLLCLAAGAAGGVLAAVLVHDPFTTPLLCTSAALFTAAVIPWGSGAQSAAAALALVAGSLAAYLVAGRAAAGEPIVGMVVISGLSVYIARVLERQRAAEARAILALQRHQAELAHVLRVSAMGEMGAQLAHELTQPLGAIANYAAGCRRRMEMTPAASPELIDAVERIAREAMRAGAIIRRMREFLRKAEPQRAAVDVNALVREVAELLDGEARERGVDVDLLLDASLPPVQADGVEIEQVLVNLARNAIEAMQGSSGARTLAIETRLRQGTIEVFVRDSGPGLPDDDAGRIFEAFHTTKPRGLGMGLAISRTLIELHGGTLTATSGPSGATFRFTLPVQAPAAAVAS